MFWIIDAFWRHLQRRSGFRFLQITEFLNNGDLQKSFQENRLINFIVMDPVGTQYKHKNENKQEKEYDNYCSLWRTLWYPEIVIFYFGFSVISLIIWVCSKLLNY